VLWRPEEHDRLADEPWDEGRARDGIAAIVADAEQACDGTTWPVHPKDEPDEAEPPWTTMYLGSAGTCYALHRLGSELDVGAVVERALARYRERPDFPEFGDPRSLLGGEAGLLLVARLVGSPAADDARLRELIHENRGNPTWEWMWGSPGTMLAARELGFEQEWHESAELLWAAWDPETNLFTNDLYGKEWQFLGPGHGLAGAVHALRGFRDDELRARVEAVFEREALRQGELANWPPLAGTPDPERIRVQWCHGAPGIVATIGDLLPLELATAGANLTWRAGPIRRGPGLCHGTAGNGYALLRMHALTGDESWLDCARCFAMHALVQVEADRAEHGRGRYSLWTGDVGVALYLRSCLEADARFPTLERW
jgi:Lanthionine synthetase C-like protein